MGEKIGQFQERTEQCQLSAELSVDKIMKHNILVRACMNKVEQEPWNRNAIERLQIPGNRSTTYIIALYVCTMVCML